VNRRKFLGGISGVVLGSVAFYKSSKQPAVAVDSDFNLDNVYIESDNGEVDSVIIEFDTLDVLATNITNKSDDLTITVSAEIETENSAELTTQDFTVSNSNTKFEKDQFDSDLEYDLAEKFGASVFNEREEGYTNETDVQVSIEISHIDIGTKKLSDEFVVEVENVDSMPDDAIGIYDWSDLDSIRDEPDEFYALGATLNKDTDGYDELVNDSNGWEPIEVGFDGTLDGRGYIIKDLVLTDAYGEYTGLFGRDDGEGTIKNLGLVDVDADSPRPNGFYERFSGIVEHCFSTGTYFGTEEYNQGGLVGQSDGPVENCYSIVDISSVGDNSEIGGLVGDQRSELRTSYPAGEVEGTGGLIGNSRTSVIDSYWDIEASNEDSSPDGDGKTTDEMTGSSAKDELNGFDFDDVWETVEATDPDATDDGYPILQSINRESQLRAQGLYDG